MATSFPQILLGISTWSDSRAELVVRRNLITATMVTVRRVVHVVVGKRAMNEPEDCLVGSHFQNNVRAEPCQSQLTGSEKLQWLSRAKYASHLLDKEHGEGVLIKQLEMGEAVMKGVTMKVPAKLYEVLGLRNM